ncbi:MAG: rsmI [Burkholderiales bacterium]|nr:rsmI [Burkholderiales bacterium]
MLYICATPIGNLKDISLRALEILSASDIILCEDTRTSKQLLLAHGINYKQLIALHQHNENQITEKVLSYLEDGLTITQISDAGTPGVSDPGARLCKAVLDAGYKVSPIPGACAYISLLSVAGLNAPSLFYGFLPSTKNARIKVLEEWINVPYAVGIYESPHRILESITDIITVLGEYREIILGRELTKQFETIKQAAAVKLLEFVRNDPNQQRGEFVLLIYPKVPDKKATESLSSEQIRVLSLLLPELPPKKAVNIANKLTGANKDLLYRYAVESVK